MLELYHSINSVCAQKVRIALAEKGLQATEHLMTLRGDQFDPAYMKLNPNAVVPTLIHDGNVIVESSVILYYLDEAFPEKPLMPHAPLARAKVRMFNKLVDEYIHNACIILTFGTAFRPALLRLSPEEREAQFSKSPIKKRAEIKRDVVAHGLESEFMRESLESHDRLLHWIDDAMKTGPYLVLPGRASLWPISGLFPMSCGLSSWASRGFGTAIRRSARGGNVFATDPRSNSRS
jgi:glutathione S-transferase